jgi:hypothetical protein
MTHFGKKYKNLVKIEKTQNLNVVEKQADTTPVFKSGKLPPKPDGYFTTKEIAKELGIGSSLLYSFVSRTSDFIDRVMKVGAKRRKYRVFYYDPKLREDILEAYNKPVVPSFDLTELLDSHHITSELLEYIGRHYVVHQENGYFINSGDVPGVNGIIYKYFRYEKQFHSLPYLVDLTGLSRQRIHQMVTRHSGDSRILILKSGKFRKMLVHKDFVDSIAMRDQIVEVPNNLISIADLADKHKILQRDIKNILDDEDFVVLNGIRYYDISVIGKISTPDFKKKSDWVAITYVSKHYMVNNQQVHLALKLLGINTREYIRPRNGKKEGTQMVINPEAFRYLDAFFVFNMHGPVNNKGGEA